MCKKKSSRNEFQSIWSENIGLALDNTGASTNESTFIKYIFIFYSLICLAFYPGHGHRDNRTSSSVIPLPQQLPRAPLDLKLSGLFWKVSSLQEVLGRSPRLFTVSHAWNTFKGRCPRVQPSLSIWRSNSSSPLNLSQLNLQSFANRLYPVRMKINLFSVDYTWWYNMYFILIMCNTLNSYLHLYWSAPW